MVKRWWDIFDEKWIYVQYARTLITRRWLKILTGTIWMGYDAWCVCPNLKVFDQLIFKFKINISNDFEVIILISETLTIVFLFLWLSSKIWKIQIWIIWQAPGKFQCPSNVFDFFCCRFTFFRFTCSKIIDMSFYWKILFHWKSKFTLQNNY